MISVQLVPATYICIKNHWQNLTFFSVSEEEQALFTCVTQRQKLIEIILQLRLADLRVLPFVFCQDLSLIFLTLPSPPSFASNSKIVPYCGQEKLPRHSNGEGVVGLHVPLPSSRPWRPFFETSLEHYRLRKNKLLRQYLSVS